MNQGNDKRHQRDDGVFHDGCLIFKYPDGRCHAFFMAFQSQTFHTDDKTGHAIAGDRSRARAAVRVTGSTRKKSTRKKKKAPGRRKTVR